LVAKLLGWFVVVDAAPGLAIIHSP
jgi:hypothetical protein